MSECSRITELAKPTMYPRIFEKKKITIEASKRRENACRALDAKPLPLPRSGVKLPRILNFPCENRDRRSWRKRRPTIAARLVLDVSTFHDVEHVARSPFRTFASRDGRRCERASTNDGETTEETADRQRRCVIPDGEPSHVQVSR